MTTVLVGGSVRCGKSAFALSRARRTGGRLAYVATAEARDQEMAERIDEHRRERGPEFETYEEPLALAERVRRLEPYDAVVVDCLTLWISNLLLRGDDAAAVERAVEDLVGVLTEPARSATTYVLVTNEVGMGLVPDNALGRVFRDSAGRAHQRLARAADEIYVGMLGAILRLRPAPLMLVA